VAGLLRAGKLHIKPESGTEITTIRDAGAQDVFDKDRGFRNADIFPAGEDDIGVQARARICQFFSARLHHSMDREDHAIADAVAQLFPALAQRLRAVQTRLLRLPGSPTGPATFTRLADVLEQCVRTCRQTRPTVALVKRHLDTLQDGVQLLQIYDAELTDQAIAAVTDAQRVLDYHYAQLRELGIEATNLVAAAERVEEQLATERPWRDIAHLADALNDLRECYRAERQRLLAWQGQQLELARARVKARDGFSTLTGEQSHQVLRPFTSAATNTTPEAVAPALVALRDPFVLALQRAEDEANDQLDTLLTQGAQPLIARVDLQLRNRELATEADVEALVDELRSRLLQHVRAGARVRLL
jgi:hypothetical protein